jgi:HSP20 family molecular chaperone IbpA
MTADRETLVEAGRSVPRRVLETVGRAVSRVHEESPLPADVLESDDEVRVVLDAPGASASDVSAQVTDGVLDVRIDRFRPFNEGFEMVFPGRGLELDASVPLPDAALEPAEATASLSEHGTLVVTIPKSAAA